MGQPKEVAAALQHGPLLSSEAGQAVPQRSLIRGGVSRPAPSRRQEPGPGGGAGHYRKIEGQTNSSSSSSSIL